MSQTLVALHSKRVVGRVQHASRALKQKHKDEVHLLYFRNPLLNQHLIFWENIKLTIPPTDLFDRINVTKKHNKN